MRSFVSAGLFAGCVKTTPVPGGGQAPCASFAVGPSPPGPTADPTERVAAGSPLVSKAGGLTGRARSLGWPDPTPGVLSTMDLGIDGRSTGPPPARTGCADAVVCSPVYRRRIPATEESKVPPTTRMRTRPAAVFPTRSGRGWPRSTEQTAARPDRPHPELVRRAGESPTRGRELVYFATRRRMRLPPKIRVSSSDEMPRSRKMAIWVSRTSRRKPRGKTLESLPNRRRRLPTTSRA